MSLANLRGHRELAARLMTEVSTRPSHAYLFAGQSGVGKALIAEGLAHSLLCEHSPGSNFCCTPDRCPVRADAAGGSSRCDCCAACVQVAARVHPGFTYVARPRNRTDVLIEQVRKLIAELWLRPARGATRVAIVNDAETLNIPAQNALLKTLEEPPGHAIIFLITQSERSLLDTVRSRLRPVRFGPLAAADVEAILTERTRLDPARARAIARLSRGSIGRALSLVQGEPPPIKELVEALKRLPAMDYSAASSLAQDFFANREQAAENFELIARLLEEILCFKLLRAEVSAPPPEVAPVMAELGDKLSSELLAKVIRAAVKSISAIEAMANPRLQAESWWMSAAQAARSQ